MPRYGCRPRLVGPPDAATRGNAVERIDAACRLAVAAKLALRDLAAWVRGLPVSETEFRLLWLLFQRERAGKAHERALDQMELAAQLAISPAQISGVVEHLQTCELIDRVRDGADRRRQLWRLAQPGEALVLDVVASVQAIGDRRDVVIPPLTPPFEGGGSEAAA